mmetsp:Transcript_39020/g.96027  ORF Transcript_39020/g.96027 Transcript_39020/m.96027 type:complete len:542 (-) Transcript_39020:133-1758(-)
MVLGLDLLLELLDLVVHDLELPLHLIDLVLCLYQILAVQVPVGAHSLVQILLLLQLLLPLLNRLLQIHDRHLPDLDLLKRLEVLSRSVRRLLPVLLSLLLERIDHLALLLSLCLVPHNLGLQVLLGVLLHLYEVRLLLCSGLGLAEVVLQQVLLPCHVFNILLVKLHLPPLALDLTLKLGDLAQEDVPRPLHLDALLLHILDLLHHSLLHPSLLAGQRPNLIDLILFQLELDLPLRILCQKLLVCADLLLKILLQLLGLLRERVVVLVCALHLLLRLLELDLEPRELLLPLCYRLLLRLSLLSLTVERDLDLLDLLLQALLLPLLPLNLRAALSDLLLQRHDICLVSELLRLKSTCAVVQVHDLIARRDELLREVVALRRQLLLLLRQLVHCVLLPQSEPCALLDEARQVCDLEFELLDSLLGALLLLVARVHHLPRFLNLLLERRNRVLVLLRQLQRGLHLGCIGHNLLVELATLLDQPLLALVRLLQRAVQLLVLHTEPLKRFVSDEVLEHLLEVALKGLEGATLEAHLLEAILLLSHL